MSKVQHLTEQASNFKVTEHKLKNFFSSLTWNAGWAVNKPDTESSRPLWPIKRGKTFLNLEIKVTVNQVRDFNANFSKKNSKSDFTH